MNREDILKAFPLVEWLPERGVKLTHGGRRASRCPVKEHTRADTVSVDHGKGVWHCHSCGMGGTVVDWLAAEKGITASEAFKELAAQVDGGESRQDAAPTKSKPSSIEGQKQNAAVGNVDARPRIVAEYPYTDEGGKLLFQCVRFEPKTFRQRRPDPEGKDGWTWNLLGVRLVLYRLPAVVKAEEVWIVEGEKDAESLAAAGLCATCNPMGAGKWREGFNDSLRGKRVVIVPDNDEPGRKHSDAIARALVGVAASVKVLTLPESVGGAAVKDGTDFIGTFQDSAEAAERLATMADGAPEWTPKAAELPATSAPATAPAAKPKLPMIELCAPSALKSYEPPPGSVLVGSNHIVRGSVFVIGGAPGVGKSRAAVALAVAGATAADWFGLTIHRRFKTVILQTENGRIRLKDEFAGMDCAALDEYVRVSPQPPYGLPFDRADFVAELRAGLDTFKPDVVLLDPWNACARDEKARDYLDTFDAIRTALPSGDDAPALGIVAHTRKPKGDEKTTGRGLLNLLAGSYVLASVPRAAWVMQAASNEPDDARVVWTCCKNSDGPMEKAGAWIRGNGIFQPVENFDWTAFFEGSGGSGGKRGITEDDVARMFDGGRFMAKKAAVEELMETVGCAKSAAYDALRTDPKRRFKALKERDGLLRWVSEEGKEE
jgi:hypothetical protein